MAYANRKKADNQRPLFQTLCVFPNEAQMNASVTAPASSRTSVNPAASISSPPSAIRQRIELNAKAVSANAVRRKDFIRLARRHTNTARLRLFYRDDRTASREMSKIPPRFLR